MITIKKLKIFRKNNGDGDMWLKTTWPWQRNTMTADDWTTIGELIDDFKLIDRGLASDSYKEGVLEKINANCEDEKTIEELRKLAREM
ncbi:MAG: hypothetical protein EOO13_12165 [Chitinophagaceae bacterium]|nr:MAG: hypothetical protein EOO13_12165 [Chitinophagaceae bacterium]